MMNDARLMVGDQALACASASYMHSLNYARTRIQGRHLLQMMDKNAPAVPIIQHPDVRRMLMIMKIYVESLRSLSAYIAFCFDGIATTADPEEKDQAPGHHRLPDSHRRRPIRPSARSTSAAWASRSTAATAT